MTVQKPCVSKGKKYIRLKFFRCQIISCFKTNLFFKKLVSRNKAKIKDFPFIHIIFNNQKMFILHTLAYFI